MPAITDGPETLLQGDDARGPYRNSTLGVDAGGWSFATGIGGGRIEDCAYDCCCGACATFDGFDWLGRAFQAERMARDRSRSSRT